jgi:hypothetical protein
MANRAGSAIWRTSSFIVTPGEYPLVAVSMGAEMHVRRFNATRGANEIVAASKNENPLFSHAALRNIQEWAMPPSPT